MRVCGIELKGSDAILALIDKNGQDIEHVSIATKKIPLGDGECCVQVKSFKETFESFCRENAVDKIVIKIKRKKRRLCRGGRYIQNGRYYTSI
ncbi:DUF3010 family protein [Vibrio coralliilyticus]|uniref:DUF3010 family protein n=1 Tax=Vibrio coralliilyticus TaxID=190893 RepID=UPI001C253CDA|nr:DUF3010 family protein [Vibrio coralliilyticus]